jgi:predicted deacylase
MFKPAELLSAADKASYEYERAEYLKTYLDQAETLLDIHASYTPESRRFVICEPNAADIVKYLPVDLVVSGFDQVEPGGTDYYMNSRGKIGICIECGYLGDPASVQVAERGIDAFLRAAGHLGNDLSETPQSYIRMNEIYLTTSNDFKLSRPFADFDSVSEGEVVGLDSGREVRAEEEGIILFARNCQKAGEEAFLLGEKKSGLA